MTPSIIAANNKDSLLHLAVKINPSFIHAAAPFSADCSNWQQKM